MLFFNLKILISLYKILETGFPIQSGAAAKLPLAADFAGPFTLH
jgi:hypothetical protein